jgi:ATP-binding cassette subfamily F protein uup
MNYISAENISKDYGERVLFEGLSFGLSKGDKIALIANNGTGKTSLLKILVGWDTPDSGKVAVREGIRIGFLEQEPVFDESLTIEQLILSGHSEVMAIILKYEHALEAQIVHHTPEAQKALEQASAKMDENNAWDYERRIKQILGKFNIKDLDQRIFSLSGGQKKRLAMALVLLDEPELLILDEPTNHLDIAMIEWLEKYLSQNNVTLLMVTHDRYFLDNVCNQILEMNDGELYHHKGGYAYFLEKRAERETAFKTEIDKAGLLMKKELEWMRRSPKARTTKSKSRIESFYQIEEKATSGKKVEELKLEVKMTRIGGKILELKKVSKSYGDLTILKGFDYTFKKGERIGIIGANGTGKTTFLNLITGIEQPDSGKINTGETIVYGYYSQEGIALKGDKRVIDVLKDIADVIIMGDGTSISASQLLQQFMFSPAMQYTYVSKLSGGEKRRLYLLTVLIRNPNFLILDEPTNDLDLLTLNKLEEFLQSFGGCLILVSHDRYFMDTLVDHLFIFEGNAVVRDFNGNYTEYRVEKEESEQKEKEQKAIDKKSGMQVSNTPTKEKKKMSFKEKFEFENLEKEIATLEGEKVLLEKTLAESGSNYEVLQKISGRISEIIPLIEEKGMRWLELSELEN